MHSPVMLVLRREAALFKEELIEAEIQIRTVAMDFWASLEHQLRYKPSGTITPEISEELRQCAERIAETDIQMQKLYNEINDME